MELNDLITLAAASLLGNTFRGDTSHLLDTREILTPSDEAIRVAVITAKEIWDEVLQQDSED